MNLPALYSVSPKVIRDAALTALSNGWTVEIGLHSESFWCLSIRDSVRYISLYHFTRKGRQVTETTQKWFHCPGSDGERMTKARLQWTIERQALTD